MTDLTKISKSLSYWLRHRPDDGDLTLDSKGWTSVDDVMAALHKKGMPSDFETLVQVVEENDKKRFEFSPDLTLIRARQGHSVDVDLDLKPSVPPVVLYHGTINTVVAEILKSGLKKMNRHHVHLSPDAETARKVGSRRGAPVILIVDAKSMYADGFKFFVTDNGVWLTDEVPAKYVTPQGQAHKSRKT